LPHEIAGRIEVFIRRQFRLPDEDPRFSRDVHLFEAGYVDSAGVIELILFIESNFGVTLGDEHIFSDQFTSINGIAGILTSSAERHDVSAALR
jgi:acyl carrier protein